MARVVGVFALIAGLMPVLQMVAATEPFWTGHPLAAIGDAVRRIPTVWTLVLGLCLGGLAIGLGRRGPYWRTGGCLGVLAVAVSAGWLLLMAAALLLIRSWESQ